MSLQDRLLKWFKQMPMQWVSGVQVERTITKNTKHGGAYATRELRKLAEDKRLEREERSTSGRNLAWYRYNPRTDSIEWSRQMVAGFDSLPCCPLKCEGGEMDSTKCKTLHPLHPTPTRYNKRRK